MPRRRDSHRPSCRPGWEGVFDPGARDGRGPSQGPGGPAPKRREQRRRAHSAGLGSHIAALLAHDGLSDVGAESACARDGPVRASAVAAADSAASDRAAGWMPPRTRA